MKKLIDKNFQDYKIELKEITNELINFCDKIENFELSNIIKNLNKNIDEPNLLVIVGEVKAGKSSFINALVGANICKVNAAPCTAKVEQIVYSNKSFRKEISENIIQLGLDSDILKEISIVDTPGTNTIIEHHQDITKKFIPNSDLIFFVFSAKNPYTQTAWDLLEYVKDEWKKKLVFVLQQADLTSKEELEINKNNLIKHAKEKGIKDIILFTSSAKYEFENKENSGFKEIRNYIQKIISKNNYKIKLESIITSLEEILSKIENNIEYYKKELEYYNDKIKKIKKSLENGERQSKYEIDSLIKRLILGYDKEANTFKLNIAKALSASKFLKMAIPFNKGNSIKEEIQGLQDDFKKKVEENFKKDASQGAEYLIENIRNSLEEMLEDLKNIEKNYKDENFYNSIPDNRLEIIQEVRQNLEDLMINNSFINSIEKDVISPGYLKEGAVAIVSGIILASTNITFLDITGGILTSAGILLSGGILFFKRGKIIKQFENEIDKTKEQFEIEINKRLSSKFKSIYIDIERGFKELYHYVEDNKKIKEKLINDFSIIKEKHIKLSSKIRSKI